MSGLSKPTARLRHTVALNLAFGLLSVLSAWLFVISGNPALAWYLAILFGIAVIGSWNLNHRLTTFFRIERQLQAISACPTLSAETLQTMPDNDVAAHGWNRLVESACVQRLLDSATIEASQSGSSPTTEHAVTILDLISDGVAVSDASGFRLFQNPAFASMLDCDDGFHGMSDSLRLHELFRKFHNFADHLSDLVNPDSLAPQCFELHRTENTADGVFRVTRMCFSQEDSTFLWTVRDVTQQKLSVEMRDCFVSAATHELRTPLANIQAYSETLIDGGEINADDQKQFLNVIMAEAKRLDRIIDDLLNISHMQAGGLTVDRHETQIDRLLTDVLETIRPLFASKAVEFEASIPPRLPALQVDKDKLVAALVNLLGNAGKYTPDGGHVSLHAEHDGNEVRFHVEDTGIGISETEQKHVFDRFFRSSDARVSEVRGTGLGLAFAQDVARLHGGRIEVSSELNKGSRFSFILPASLAKQPARGSSGA